MFVEVAGEKLVGGIFPPILNWVKIFKTFAFTNTLPKFLF